MEENANGDAPRDESRTDEARAADYLALAEKMLSVCDSVKKEGGK